MQWTNNVAKLCLVLGLCVPMRAFVALSPTIHSRGGEVWKWDNTISTSYVTPGRYVTCSSSHSVNEVELAKQELMIAFRMMDEKNLDFMQLGKQEFEFIGKYVNKLVSPSKSLEGQRHDVSMLAKEGKLCGCWELKWSDEDRFNIFPRLGIEVMNYIFEPEGGRFDNVIRFKNSPMNSIRVTTKYKVNNENRISLDFNSIVVNLFGINIPFPFFWDKGGYVEIQYYDGLFWIERLKKKLSDGSKRQYTSIYVRASQPLTNLDKKEVISRRRLLTTN